MGSNQGFGLTAGMKEINDVLVTFGFTGLLTNNTNIFELYLSRKVNKNIFFSTASRIKVNIMV